MVILGTVLSVTSPKFIKGPQVKRKASSRSLNGAFASISTGSSVPEIPKSCARITTQGMPLSIIVTAMPLT